MGIPESEAETLDMDGLKQKFESQFIKRDVQAIKDDKELFGKATLVYNEVNKGKLKKLLKDNGVEFATNELDKLNIPEIIDNYFVKAFQERNEKISTLEKSSGESNDKKYNQLKTEFDQYKADTSSLVEKYAALQKEHGDYKTQKENEFTSYKIGQYESEGWNKFPWANTANEFERDGFKGRVEKKYKNVMNAEGKIETRDENGQLIKHPSKAGQYLSFAEVLEMEGLEANKKGAKIFGITQEQPARQSTTVSFNKDNNGTPPATDNPRRRMNTATRPQPV